MATAIGTRRAAIWPRSRSSPFGPASTWQGAAEHPDPKLNWLELHADGGHPGPGNLAAVMRFVVRRPAVAGVEGTLKHDNPNGDGVEAHVVVSRRGEIGRFVAEHGEVQIQTEPVEVQPGDTIDLVVTCRQNNGYDRFFWKPLVRLQPAGDPIGRRDHLGSGRRISWSAAATARRLAAAGPYAVVDQRIHVSGLNAKT